jgi:hypothetical protein
MYNIGPLESLRRMAQRLQREGQYWITRLTRLLPGARSRRPQMADPDDFKGSPVLLIAVGCAVGLCLCVVAAVAIVAVLVIVSPGGGF